MTEIDIPLIFIFIHQSLALLRFIHFLKLAHFFFMSLNLMYNECKLNLENHSILGWVMEHLVKVPAKDKKVIGQEFPLPDLAVEKY